MHSSLTDATQWATREFSQAELGDKRRTKRLVKIAELLATRPSGTLPSAIKELKEIKGAYDFISTRAVTREKVIAAHVQHTREQLNQPGEYLQIEDTTLLDFSMHFATKGLGRIGDDDGRGLNLHTTLALRVNAWIGNRPQVDIIGLSGQHCWARTDPPHKGRESRHQRLERARESQRWAQAISQTDGPPPGCQWTYIADRESDIYEVFDRCLERRVDFIVRANQPRALLGEGQSIFSAVAAAACRGTYHVHLRARPKQPAHTATVEVRAIRVRLRPPWRPDRRLESLELNAVEAKEIGAPAGATPIHWVLLTTLPCDTFDQMLRVIAAYAKRWLIEEYHKALKTGTHVEKSQLATAQRLQVLLGILAIVAMRLLRLKLLVEIEPDQPIAWDETTQAIQTVLSATVGTPKGGWTNRTLLISVAKLGGFLGRKSDGNPGWITLWRGIKELVLLVQGYDIAGASPK